MEIFKNIEVLSKKDAEEKYGYDLYDSVAAVICKDSAWYYTFEPSGKFHAIAGNDDLLTDDPAKCVDFLKENFEYF